MTIKDWYRSNGWWKNYPFKTKKSPNGLTVYACNIDSLTRGAVMVKGEILHIWTTYAYKSSLEELTVKHLYPPDKEGWEVLCYLADQQYQPYKESDLV